MTTSGARPPVPDWDPEADRIGGARGGGTRSPERLSEEARLRRDCPVAYSERYGGFYSLTRYADVVKAAVDHQHFASGSPFVTMPDLNGLVPGSLNPPQHAPYRRLFNTYFARERMEALEPLMRRYAEELLAPLLAAGGGDIVRAFCQPLPARALAALMNLPDAAYLELVEQIAGFEEIGWDPDEVNRIIFAVFSEHIRKVIAARRAEPLDPEHDVLSGAMALEIDGEPLSDEAVVGIGVSMIGAGHATTADALSTAIHRLATDPAIQARLRREPELIPQAVEEFLRIETPLPDLGRHATADIELHGRTIPAGCPVSLNYGSANRDAAAFAHPEACIIDRTPNKHLAFGHGVHKCAGAPLARLELRVALDVLLRRTRNIELAGRAESSDGLVLNGFVKLPVRVTV